MCKKLTLCCDSVYPGCDVRATPIVCGKVNSPVERIEKLRDEAKGLVKNFFPRYMSPDIGNRFVDCIIDCAVEIAISKIYQAQKEGK